VSGMALTTGYWGDIILFKLKVHFSFLER
jgi:hypothetical protein